MLNCSFLEKFCGCWNFLQSLNVDTRAETMLNFVLGVLLCFLLYLQRFRVVKNDQKYEILDNPFFCLQKFQKSAFSEIFLELKALNINFKF